MKTIFILLLFPPIFFACAHTTSVEGKVTHALTGEPLANIPVVLKISNGYDPHDSIIPKIVEESETHTDENGMYYVEAEGRGIDDAFLYVGEYCTNFFKSERTGTVSANHCETVDVRLIPVDGKLDVLLSNPADTVKHIFIRVNNAGNFAADSGCEGQGGTFSIDPGTSYTMSIKVLAARFVQIHWGPLPFEKYASPFADSVYCNRGETAFYKITL